MGGEWEETPPGLPRAPTPQKRRQNWEIPLESITTKGVRVTLPAKQWVQELRGWGLSDPLPPHGFPGEHLPTTRKHNVAGVLLRTALCPIVW